MEPTDIPAAGDTWFWRRRREVAAALWAAALAAAAILLLATPTLNLDDLLYAAVAPALFADQGFWHTIGRVFLNDDLGVSELRTYGLARVIQLTGIATVGIRPVATYGAMLLCHGLSGCIVYRLVRDAAADRAVGLLATLMWVASPAVLPLLKVEHHFLYLIAPYYPLLAWVWLAGRVPFAAGAALLTLTWLLGEGAIIPMGVAVLMTAWARRDARLLLQGAVAFALLGLYVGHQMIAVNDPAHHAQRFHFVLSKAKIRQAMDGFGHQLKQNGRAILGLAHHDAELNGHVSGAGVYKGPLVPLAAGALFLSALAVLRRQRPPSVAARDPHMAAVLLAVAVFSPAVYALYVAAGAAVLAIRYTAAFYALVPLAMVTAVAVVCSASVGRVVAAAAAAATVAVSLGLLVRAEVLVNQPNRRLFAGLTAGDVIVLRHAGWDIPPDGTVNGAYPGLQSTLAYGFANPMRSAWTAGTALPLYSGASLGTACRVRPDGRVEVWYAGKMVGTFPPARVHVMGLTSPTARAAVPLDMAGACTPPAP